VYILTYEQKKGKKEKASANKAAANPSTRQPSVAKQPADAASLVGLEDKPQEPKLLDIEDKVEADTTLKVP
jgi:hypothetical protein